MRAGILLPRAKRGCDGYRVPVHVTSRKKGGWCMNKADLIEAVAGVTSTKKEAAAAVDCVLETITKALKKKQDVTLVGFGTFSVRKRKARSAFKAMLCHRFERLTCSACWCSPHTFIPK